MNNNKKNYDIKLELLVPVTITYRVSAIDEQDALKELDKPSARKIAMQQYLHRRIKLKATVYQPNTNMIKLSKTYRSI